MNVAADEKTEKATPKRRQDERKKGNVFQSNDVIAVCSLLVLFNSLNALAPKIYRTLMLPPRRPWRRTICPTSC